MINVLPPTRNRDKWGAGYYGARRGNRKHSGEDFHVPPGTKVCAMSSGTVTKLGYAYSDDLSYRYIEVQDDRGFFCRYMYVNPGVGVGDKVDLGAVLGESQALGPRYPGITEHFHFEVFSITGKSKRRSERTYYNPRKYLAGDL